MADRLSRIDWQQREVDLRAWYLRLVESGNANPESVVGGLLAGEAKRLSFLFSPDQMTSYWKPALESDGSVGFVARGVSSFGLNALCVKAGLALRLDLPASHIGGEQISLVPYLKFTNGEVDSRSSSVLAFNGRQISDLDNILKPVSI